MILATDSEFDQGRLQRRRRVPVSREWEVWMASPEDVIIKKLADCDEGRSEKHVRDIAGMPKTQSDQLDQEYIERWVDRFGLRQIWREVVERVERREPPTSPRIEDLE